MPRTQPADELTGQTNTYKFCSLYDSATEIEAVTSTEDVALQSITYNNLIESGATADREKGEEVADYTMNYNLKKDLSRCLHRLRRRSP